MMNESLYMELRLLGLFRSKYKMESIKVNKLFKDYDIYKYIEECYDTLHMNGDEYILNDICEILKSKGAIAKC